MGISPLKDSNGVIHTSPEGKASLLNNQFQSVFTKPSPLSLKELSRKAHTGTDTVNTMPDILVSLPGVTKLLSSLKPHKAAGPDRIKPLVLKELAIEIAPILRYIFQRSLDTGEVPRDWRDANVTPIYKKGSGLMASNYRPVSLTCICSKVLEHIIVSGMKVHLESSGILCDRQHGFREKRSCETQLVDFVHELSQHLNKGQQVDAIIMDFSKAFDRVAHNALLHKLGRVGVTGKTQIWIQNFLSNRRQQVVVEGSSSPQGFVTSGVPQGSVIGPILFLIYINDLPASVSSEVRLFADDTIVYRHIKTPTDCDILQSDLLKLESWEREWQMEFHPGKCTVLRITRKQKPIVHNYLLHGQELPEAKYLGVTISHDLSWNKHIQDVTAKANRTLGFVRRNLRVSSPKIKERAYFGVVRPRLEYASVVWDPHSAANAHAIEMVQRRAARWALHRWHNTSSVTAMLNQLKWRTLQQRRVDARLCMWYKMVHGLVSLSPLSYTQPITRMSRRAHSCGYVPLHSTKDVLRYSFVPRTVFAWNSLPPDLVTADSFRGRVMQLNDHPSATF
jgi:hypothetical protein